MMRTQILAPAAVLICWTLVMLLWMARSRFAAFAKANIDLSRSKPGGRGGDLQGVLPDDVMWKSHNYTHLMEQPTIFYATVMILALVGAGTIDVALAWAYAGLRIAHSLWQSTVNRIPVRLRLFMLSTFCLIVLAARALWATLLGGPTIGA